MASSDFHIGSTGPVTPPSTSRALTRVTPVSPRAVQESGSPLKRSGLDVREIIAAPDEVVVRSRTPSVALELGLENARGSIVRNQPADVLATLDEVWSGARHTETGWYLRGGALALLGLPGEAARVVAEALVANPGSAANHFLQSLANLTLGDLEAARRSLEHAAEHSEPDALILIQHALLAAHDGDSAEAHAMIKRAALQWPDHPALAYGRSAMRELLKNEARDIRRSRTPVLLEAFAEDNSVNANEELHVNDVAREPAAFNARDVTAEALRTLGAQLKSGTRRSSLDEARSLLASLSAGGTLATSMSAARAHATRAVIGAIIDALGNGPTTGLGWEAESIDGHWQRSAAENIAGQRATDDANLRGGDALRTVVRAFVTEVREGRVFEADQQLQRARGTVSDTTFNLLRSILDADDDVARRERAIAADNGNAYIRNGEAGHVLLAPLRLGLALLPEAELPKRSVRTASGSDAAVTYGGGIAAASHVGREVRAVGAHGSAGSMAAALGLIAGAVVAFSVSAPIMAIALAGGGAWLAIRRSGKGS